MEEELSHRMSAEDNEASTIFVASDDHWLKGDPNNSTVEEQLDTMTETNYTETKYFWQAQGGWERVIMYLSIRHRL